MLRATAEPRWMGTRVHLLEPRDRDPRVDLCGREIGVAEHLLDVTDVGAALEHERGHGVAEEVARAALADVRGRDVAAHEFTEEMRCLSSLFENHPYLAGGFNVLTIRRTCTMRERTLDGFGPRLARLRKGKGLTQAELGEMVGGISYA